MTCSTPTCWILQPFLRRSPTKAPFQFFCTTRWLRALGKPFLFIAIFFSKSFCKCLYLDQYDHQICLNIRLLLKIIFRFLSSKILSGFTMAVAISHTILMSLKSYSAPCHEYVFTSSNACLWDWVSTFHGALRHFTCIYLDFEWSWKIRC